MKHLEQDGGEHGEIKRTFERIPTTQFELVDINLEANLLSNFMERGGYWLDLFFKTYPELESISKEAHLGTDKYKVFLEKIRETEKVKMEKGREELQSRWDEIGPQFLATLAEHFETDWPEGRDIKGYVSVLPVYPRFLDKYSYFVDYKNIGRAIEIAAHETLHFLWFKKWKEVFPESQRVEYEKPHLAWRLSEIMDPIILQCHPEIKRLINPTMWGYASFKTRKIGEVGMTDYFKTLYEESVAAGDSFDVILKKIWAGAQKHEAEIGQF